MDGGKIIERVREAVLKWMCEANVPAGAVFLRPQYYSAVEAWLEKRAGGFVYGDTGQQLPNSRIMFHFETGPCYFESDPWVPADGFLMDRETYDLVLSMRGE